jgi:DNA-binding NarL/FixJ family response regulator
MDGRHVALVVDPSHEWRAAIRSTLDRINVCTQDAASGNEALAAVEVARPSLMIVEVTLPDTSGYELCRELREVHRMDLPIILLSGRHTRRAERVAGLLLGADEYILKPFDADELLARTRNLLRRVSPRAPARRANLTPREHEIISLLAEGYDQAGIADQLVISPRTVSTHLERILAKAGVHSRAQAVSWAYQHGLVA